MVGKFEQFRGVIPVLSYGMIEPRQKAAAATLGKYRFESTGIFRTSCENQPIASFTERGGLLGIKASGRDDS